MLQDFYITSLLQNHKVVSMQKFGIAFKFLDATNTWIGNEFGEIQTVWRDEGISLSKLEVFTCLCTSAESMCICINGISQTHILD